MMRLDGRQSPAHEDPSCATAGTSGSGKMGQTHCSLLLSLSTTKNSGCYK